MAKNDKLSLEDVTKLARPVANFIAQVTRKPCNVSNLELTLDDGNVLNDADVQKFKEIVKSPEKDYDWRDKLFKYSPQTIFSDAFKLLGLRLMGKFAAMKYNGGQKISINPLILAEKPTTIAWYLAHELTHVADGQNYGERRFDLLNQLASVEKELIKKKHDMGFVKGYLRPTQEVKDGKTKAESCKTELGNYMAVTESHAEYLRDQFVKSASLKIADYLSLAVLVKSLMWVPMLLIPSQRKKAAQYSAGKKLIEMAYERKVDIKYIYDNIPTAEEFSNPEKYFQRILPKKD
jgi:hypothetical protein